MRTNDAQNFEAAPSKGWLWPSVIGVLGLVLVTGAFLPSSPQWPQAAIGGLLAVLGVVTAIAGTRVRYRIDGHVLHLSAFPLVNRRVTMADITSIQRRDLEPTVWASIRFPGLALRNVRYVGVGRVTMCATRAADDILVLETSGELFGVTPRDENAFLAAVRSDVSR